MFGRMKISALKKLKSVTLCFFLLIGTAISPVAYSANSYTSNIQGKVTGVRVYPSTTVLFTLSNMPTVTGCNNAYFAFNPTWSADVTKMFLTRLLLAYSTGENLNVGYDGATCSPTNYIDVEELGL